MANEAHQKYVERLLRIGESLGYVTATRFLKDPQGDAIWYVETSRHVHSRRRLPIVAFEVLCSETPKLIKGSIATLQHISASLGVLVIVNEEYAKKSQHYKSYDERTYPEYIKRKCREYARQSKLTSRIEVWDQNKVDSLFEKICDAKSQTSS